MKNRCITTLKQLEKILENKGDHSFAISLGNGGLYSRKDITKYKNKKYGIFNSIDGSHQVLTKKQLLEPTGKWSNIGKAMKQKAFFYMGE